MNKALKNINKIEFLYSKNNIFYPIFDNKNHSIKIYYTNKNTNDLLRLGGIIGKELIKINLENKVIIKSDLITKKLYWVILGLYLSLDNFNLKTNGTELFYMTIWKNINIKSNMKIRIEKMGNSILLCRKLQKMPSNFLYPGIFSKYILDIILSLREKRVNIVGKVLDESELEKQGFGGIIGMGKGSINGPNLVMIDLNYDSKEKPIILIGKGVCFDSGGLSIKPSDNMHEMKMDMSGASTVLSSILYLAESKYKKRIIGLIPLIENIPSSNAIRPGDIIQIFGGKTVEIMDTDAEGRIIMADCLELSKKYDPRLVIDVATLTGGAERIACGKASVLMKNTEDYDKYLMSSMIETGERYIELPIWEDFVEDTKSDLADYRNYGFKCNASTMMAGVFLYNFINPYKWIHIDLATTISNSWDLEYKPMEGKGTGVLFLIYFLKQFESLQKK
jgi:leucyl aminopeptidase